MLLFTTFCNILFHTVFNFNTYGFFLLSDFLTNNEDFDDMGENIEVEIDENAVDENIVDNIQNVVPTSSVSSSDYFTQQDLTDKKNVTWIRGEYITLPFDIFEPHLNITFDLSSPLQLFSNYFSDELLETAVFNTNLYAIRNNVPNFPPTTVAELKTFIGINILMGNLGLPRVRMYWEPKFAVPLISENMTSNRFFKLRNNLHFIIDKDPNTNDRFWKVRPLYEAIRKYCASLQLESTFSVDEQMVPFKGQLNVKQYIKNKPTKWGVKLFCLCGISGMIYDFIIYQGSTTEIRPEYSQFGQSASLVMQLSERINVPNCTLFFDNYFSTFWLFEWLKNRNIYAAGTIRVDRFMKPPFTTDKEIKKHHSRGYMENLICNTSGVVLSKWYDNSSVVLASNFCGIGQVDQCRRYDKKNKKYVDVQRPEVVARYNEGMGGVDKCDHLISLYRIFIRSKKSTLRLITHGIDIAAVNSWIEYKKEAKSLGLHEKKILDLIHFRQYLAEALILSGKPVTKKRGRRDIGHTPVFLDKKEAGRCKNFGCKSKTYVSCKKCSVNLCIARKKNSFESFHSK